MNIIFSGIARCSFHYLIVGVIDGADFDLNDTLAGQNNGICGTAVHGQIGLIFGPHTDAIHLTVALADDPPNLDYSWEEIVESPLFADEDLKMFMKGFDGDPRGPCIFIPAGDYRVRYSARNFTDTSYEADLTQRYQLVIWPDVEFKPDEVIKATNPNAKRLHHPILKY